LWLVTVLQLVEHLTDRQAVAAVSGRIDWKYALSLELNDPGFDNSVLAEFRARLVRNDLARLAFDRLLERCRELGLVKAGGKQRTDSTHVIAAVRDLNSMESAGEAVRAFLEALATLAPAFLAETVDLEAWATRYGPPVSAWRQPRTAAERDALTAAYGRDGLLLHAIYAQRGELAGCANCRRPRSCARYKRAGALAAVARAAITARPIQVGFGRPACRRSTATSWRSTSISVSFDAEVRASSTNHDETFTNTR